MPTFLIRHKVRPLPESPHYARIGGAYATIFVSNDDQEKAERMALDWLEHYGFKSIELQGINGPVGRENASHDQSLLDLYDKAQTVGIAGDFVSFVGGGEIFN